MSHIKSVTSHGLASVRSRTGDHIHQILSNRSEVRHVDAKDAVDDADLLKQIGYKQELNRRYSTIQVFGIAFSIMGLLPSIVSTLAIGYEAGPAALVWGWLISGIFILSVGVSMSILSSAIPTSGGLFYWTNYFCPDSVRVPLSFIIGCSNTLALAGGFCSINYGFASEILAAVYINAEGDFDITNPKLYGIFAAAIVSQVIICCLTTSHTAKLQTFSIFINCFIILLFFIAVPVGAGKGAGFNSASFIFTELDNERSWTTGWSFMLSWLPSVWTIGAFDSCLHLSEEAKNASKSIPWGICGSIVTCWVLGWFICIVFTACIKDGDVEAVLSSDTGSVGAQIIYDALGKDWAVAFMALIAFAQYLMGASILVATSRQAWAFARDDGLPVVHNIVKKVNPKLKVPINATIFCGCFSLIIGLLILINATAANALFSLGIAGNYLAWAMPPFLVLLPFGASKFSPGPFYFGNFKTRAIHTVTCVWAAFIIILCMFPDNKEVEKDTMNYTIAINGGVWLIAFIYYFVYGYKKYSGPKSNLDSEDVESSDDTAAVNIDEVLGEKES
ncbi:GABA-specific permease [[Candida] jaroonii]|uniref:GABA-specific permease n=1 Tax=[Candida] jaroonii TaxID=467808 RepID=A0ACA9YFI4_9ASCO|nr:GABA-specific permease [[Candida] jaroonii]